MPGRPYLIPAALLLSLLIGLVAGCSAGPVTIAAGDLSDADAAACRSFIDALPDQLGGEQTRTITPTDALGAAYGDPAIVVTCGVGVPDEFDETSQCEEASGVGWFVPRTQFGDRSKDLTITAAGWRPRVQVVVPHHYRPDDATVGDNVSAAILGELAEPVKANLTLVDDCN